MPKQRHCTAIVLHMDFRVHHTINGQCQGTVVRRWLCLKYIRMASTGVIWRSPWLVLSPTADGQGVGVPELSIICIFAGKHVQMEVTFKTVLLNTSTTSTDLMWQAIQHFRLSSGERGHALYCIKFFWRVTVSPP